MKSILATLLFFLSLISFGQNQQKIDSIIALYSDETDKIKKGFLLLDLSQLYINTHRKKSDSISKITLKIGQEENDVQLLTEALSLLGYINYKDEKDNIALGYYKQLDSVLDSNDLKNNLLIKSKLYQSQIAKFTYTDEGMLRAKDYLDEMLELSLEIESKHYEHLTYLNIGQWYAVYSQAYEKEKNLDLAIENYNKALHYFTKQNDITNISKTYWSLSSAVRRQGNFQEAENFLKKRIPLLEKSTDTLELANAHNALATFQYRYTKQYKFALKNYQYALNVYKRKGFQNANYKLDVLNGLAFTHTKLSDYKTGFEYLDLAYLLKDSLDRNRSREATIELETKYQTEKKEKEIALLTSQNELVEEQKTNQRNLLLGGIGLSSLVGIFFFFLYSNRQKTTKKLQELDSAKSNFFTNISHEFRTPLTLISGPIQKQLKKENLQDEERNNLEMMQRNSNRLLSLVDQLLDISKIETGSLKLAISKNKILPFVGTLADSFTFTSKQKQLNYSTNVKTTTIDTWFDKDVLEKIIINLLSNAIKYTPIKGSIICNAFVKDDQLHFEVKNTGKGLSNEEATKVFERFYQINSDKQGVGIGLALVKELVELHKGSITVESTPDEWTSFKVVLPVNKECFNASEFVNDTSEDIHKEASDYISTSETNINENVSKDSDSYQDSENPILLIVDDNADVRTYVRNLFMDEYSIYLGKNGQEGIGLALEHVPDIIISDIMMPVKNGIELCNTLKVDERTSHIPIILLTAKAGEENEIKGIKTGADDYITKPFSEDLLLLKVKKLIESRKKLQARYSQEIILRPKDIAINSVDEQFLERVQIVLDDKLIESSFNIEEFSQSVGMSRMQLHRKLKALTGLSASEFIRSQRLKLAAQLLKKSDINVSQIGYSVGFNDHAYFSKCFKEMYNCTPTEYVKNTN